MDLPEGINILGRVTLAQDGTFTLTIAGLGLVMSGFETRDDAFTWAREHFEGLSDVNQQSRERTAYMAAQREEHRRDLHAAILSGWDPPEGGKEH